MPKLAIIGTGFTGASLGLALRPSKLFESIAGFDADRERARRAKQRGAIDVEARSAAAAVEGAAVVVVTAPAGEVKYVFEDIAPRLSPGAVVSDTSLWKAAALEAARALPAQVLFVGGRPVLDASGHGPEEARADVFKQAVYCLTPAADTDEGAVSAMSAVVSAVEAQAYYVSPEEHDALTAASLLLPKAVLAALGSALTRDQAWLEAGRLAGDELAAVVGQAEQLDRAFWEDAAANRAALSRWLDAAAGSLLDWRDQLQFQDGRELSKSWQGVQDELAGWRHKKRQLLESTMPPRSELRPNLLGSLTGFRARRPRPEE